MTDRRLLLTWALLMGLTILTGLAGGAVGADKLGAAWMAVLGIVTVVKGRLILARYLRLEQAPGFLGGFTAAVVVTMAVVTLSFMVISRPLVAAKPFAAPPTLVLPPR